MKLRSAFLASAVGLFSVVSPAHATNTFTFSFSTVLTHTGGAGVDNDDPRGFDGSTWNFVFTTDQTNYTNLSGFGIISTANVSLTISGATDTDYNSTFAITEGAGTNFLLLPDLSGDAVLGLGSTGAEGHFLFGPDSLQFEGLNFAGINPSAPLASATSVIQTSDWAGVSLQDLGFLVSHTGSNNSYSTSSASLVVTDLSAVPEPSSYAAFLAVAALGFGVTRRRPRRLIRT
ncbi:MAG: hypothetical protein SynsKO_40380 [Synoicihabitans sp.]